MRGLLSDCVKDREPVVHFLDTDRDTVCSCMDPVAELHL